MNKEQLRSELLKKELIKPNSTEERLTREVESLCENYMSCSYFIERGGADVGSENDILF